MLRRIRLSDFARLSEGERAAAVAEIAAAARARPNGELALVEARVRAFERRYEMPSAVMREQRAGAEADANPLVQTLLYSYNLSVQGWNNVFRYDNAHAHGAHADHHHRHAFDWRTGASQGVMGGA